MKNKGGRTMKKSCFKKIIVYIIFILLIWVGFFPGITGNIEKTSIQSIGEGPIGSPFDDDYVNVYWKFDECYANTLGDSSGHNYEGTINGATWTTDGHSGCALVFDGINDYVDLYSHSAELGFNKTDDLIFSFYFKSSGEGLIYSATAPWGENPEFRIELVSNGSLLFYLITQMCGIIMYSNGTYDNGDWHHAEYYYNGISSNPTLTLFVDGIFDNNITHWLCDILAEDYAKTKIGMHAYDSVDYFDGYIDEFKMIKYELGNKQNPPTIDGPTVGKPNVEYDYSFITNDPEGDNISSIYIDWDDGAVEKINGPFESGEEVIASHEWHEDGSYGIKAKSEDFWDDGPWSKNPYVVYIGNQPPEPPTITGPRYGDPLQQLTYTFVSDDFDEDDIKYFIDWDDGNRTETGYYASGQEVTVTHSWDIKNDYYITAKAIDINNKEGDQSEYYIRIGEQPPNKPDIEGPTKGIPGTNYKFVFTAIDPENDKVSYHIKWGDGDEATFGPFLSGKSITQYHTWNNTGTYKIQARAKDTFDYYGEWADHTIMIPRNRALNYNLLGWLFELFQL
jgi:hypothetical protein